MSEKAEKVGPLPMRIQVRRGSKTEQRHYRALLRYNDSTPQHEVLAPGVVSSPAHDLVRRGGKIIPQVVYQNIYLGKASNFAPGDVELIDGAILRALRDPRMLAVIQQYFPEKQISYDTAISVSLNEAGPTELDESDVQEKVIDLFDQGLLVASDIDRTCFNLILPPGAVLRLGNSVSLEGLGGYHGSVHVFRGGSRRTLYYSANVYSRMDGQQENGIVAFDAPWKNVVGTLYHELAEFQTDPDVGDAIRQQDSRFIGYNSAFGEEIGDQPVAANALHKVFKEIVAQPSGKATPLQLLYSNKDHGAAAPTLASVGLES